MLIITRGLPASGKSTWAREFVRADVENRAVVSRDAFRRMMHAPACAEPTPNGLMEAEITKLVKATALQLLAAGKTVVVDGTHIANRDVNAMRRLADRAGEPFKVQSFTDVPPEVCLERNIRRSSAERVPDSVIIKMSERLKRATPVSSDWVFPTEVVPYTKPEGHPVQAIIVDMDGTLANLGHRDPYDMTRVLQDQPNEAVVEVVRNLADAGLEVIVTSGRTEDARADTLTWLNQWVQLSPDPVTLLMRQMGDDRPDNIVKLELFNKHIRDHYDVVAVFDDRDQVVELWRRLGLTCMQVAPGDF